VRSRLPGPAGNLVGLAFLASGVALLSNIHVGFPLVPALAVLGLTAALAIGLFYARAALPARVRFHRLVSTGLIAGLLATPAYDISKAILSIADPSPYNPFEAIRIFGTLIVGNTAPPPWVWAAGAAFHLLNGIAFAMAYAQFLGMTAARSVRWALVTGMLWGVGLETFQLVLFPGWLSIGFVAEFATISFASHLVYGATLATVVRRRELAAQ
jgi:hypothetical protein